MAKPKLNRPETTLFLNLSVDGRITSHDSDDFDPDKTWKSQPGTRGILQQFYDFAAPGMTALTTGIYMKNLGVNERTLSAKKETFSLVVLDPDADLTPQGITYLSQNIQQLYLICLSHHPATGLFRSQPSLLTKSPQQSEDLRSQKQRQDQTKVVIISYAKEIDLNQAFSKLYRLHHIKNLFIHSIASLNADLLDAGLIDHLSVIISPLLVGGHGTPALQDSDVFTVRPLILSSIQTLSRGYVNLRYDVV